MSQNFIEANLFENICYH